MNTKYKNGLKAEAWLEVDRMNAVDERVAQAVENQEMMELSTGLFGEVEEKEGEWNGEEYIGIIRNIRPDHLAVLPDLKGACSIEDGAGFLRLNARPDKIKIVGNAMSHGNVRSLLNSWLQEKNDNAWVEDVYDDFFVFEKGGKLFKGTYSIEGNAIEISTTFEEVVRITEYRTKEGAFVGNKNKNNVKNRKDKKMKKQKKKIVDELISNEQTQWDEDDRESLMEMDRDVLDKMSPVENEDVTKPAETPVETPVEKPAEEKTEEKPAEEKPTENKAKTPEEYLSLIHI